METIPYWTRAKKRIWQETFASLKGRINPLVIGILGVVVGSLYSWLVLHAPSAEALKIGLIGGLGANVIYLLGVLTVNILRVPWLLDADSGELINTLESRAIAAESSLNERETTQQQNKEAHDLFGSLMQSGIHLSERLASLQNDVQFNFWDGKFNEWLLDVRSAIEDRGFKTYATEFQRAGENAEDVQGVMDYRKKQEQRNRVLAEHQKKLEDIVPRILS